MSYELFDVLPKQIASAYLLHGLLEEDITKLIAHRL